LLRKNDERPQITDDNLKAVNRQVSAVNGLICLKGGDLAQEISESGTRPRMMEIYDIFPETYFKEKFIVYLPYAIR
jgi:hypothetical protein